MLKKFNFIDRKGEPLPCTPHVDKDKEVNLENLSFNTRKGKLHIVEQLKDGSKRWLKKQTLLSRGAYGAVYLYETEDKQHTVVAKEFEDVEEFMVEQGLALTVGAVCGVVHSVPLNGNIIMHQYAGDLEDLALHVDVCAKITLFVAELLDCLWKNHGLVYTDVKVKNTLYRCEDDGFISIALGDIGSIEKYKEKALTEYISTFPLPSKQDLKVQRGKLEYVETELGQL